MSIGRKDTVNQCLNTLKTKEQNFSPTLSLMYKRLHLKQRVEQAFRHYRGNVHTIPPSLM